MTNKELGKLAINKTISILEEVGIKYRRNDFTDVSGYINGRWRDSSLTVTMSGNVITKVFFDDERRGKKLKKEKLKFYNYFNCRVYDNCVRFLFTKKELELENIKQEDVDATKLDSIMEKISKLLALSESDNEHEAISASLMAQKLLAKYNIDLEKIQAKDDEEIPIEEVRADVGTGNKWKYNLASVIARNYRCKCYYEGSSTIVYHGYRQDIMIARRVYMYLFSVCKRLARAYVKKIKESESRYNMDGVYNSFCAGFINGVNAELSRQCTELMIVTPKEVEKEYKTFSAKFGNKNTNIISDNTDWGAFDDGEIEGKRALNAQYIDDNSKYIED